MRVALEHIRQLPDNSLSKEITETYLEDEMCEQSTARVKTIDEMSHKQTENIYTDIFGDESYTDEDEELKPIRAATMLFTKTSFGNPKKYIGDNKSYGDPQDLERTIKSTKQETLDKIYQAIGGNHITRSKMAFSPSWLLYEALKEEVESN